MSFLARIASAVTGRMSAFAGFGAGAGNAYDAGRLDIPQMGSWNPGINHPDDEVLTNRDRIAARARDLGRNNPIIAGAVDRRTEAVVGPNIRLEAQPAFEAMNRDADWADDWATNTEAWFEVWANDDRKLCDATRTSMFGGVVETAYRHWMQDGEACATINMLDRGGPFETAVKLVDPDRLSNPDNQPEGSIYAPTGNELYGGVEVDRNGAAVAYHVRNRHQASPGVAGGTDKWSWTRVARETKTGRPRFIHAYRPGRAEQRRGVSRLVAAIKLTRIGDRLDQATLDAAILNAFMAVSVTSPYPTADVAAAMAPDGASAEWSLAEQVAYREKNRVTMPGGPVVRHFLPGEQTNVLSSQYPNGNYPEFEAAVLRKIAAATGLSYPQLSQNWADINYSSARTLLNEIWRSLLHDRWLFTQSFCTPIYAAWLEEAVARGYVKVPGGPLAFYKWRTQLVRCEWMGPGRGTIDPLKESNAADIDMHAGRSSLSMEVNERTGADYRKVLMQRSREDKYRVKIGLAPFVPLKAAGTNADPTDDETRDPNGKFGSKPGKPKNTESTDTAEEAA